MAKENNFEQLNEQNSAEKLNNKFVTSYRITNDYFQEERF